MHKSGKARSRKRPDRRGLEPAAGTCHDARGYGSTVGVLTSFASALAAAYFCFPPKFSFFISDPLNVAELGFFLVLAVIASKAVAVSKDERVTRRPKWWNPSSRAISSVARIISHPFSR